MNIRHISLIFKIFVVELKIAKLIKFYNEWVLKFEKSDWSKNPEFGVIATILELHPEIFQIFRSDIIGNEDISFFGRKDTPTVEQIVRAAIYKEMKGYDYRDLEYAQSDSRICATFIKLDFHEPFSLQTFQKYISRITASSLHEVMVEIVKLAVEEGYEDISNSIFSKCN